MVSIIIPLYNTEEFIAQALQSAISQTYRDIEIIVVNDACTDGSIDIVRDLMEKDSRIHIVSHDRNRGLSAARNTGIRSAKGEYVLFLDSDDYISSECVERCMSIVNKEKIDIVTYDADTEEESIPLSFSKCNYERNKIIKPYAVMTGYDFVKKYIHSGALIVNAWLLFLRRDFILHNKVEFLEGSYYEDNKFHFDCMIVAKSICYIPETFYHRRYRMGSIMVSELNESKIKSIFNISIGIADTLIKQNEHLDILWFDYAMERIYNCIEYLFVRASRLDEEVLKRGKDSIFSLLKVLIDRMFELYALYGVESSDKRFGFCQKIIYAIAQSFGYRGEEVGEITEYSRHYCEIIVYKAFASIGALQDSGKTVGIYGTGKYSDYVMNSYMRYGGKVSARLFYIESDCISYKKTHRGRPVVNIADVVKEKPDSIVILSSRYEKEMIEEARKRLDVPIYSLCSILGSSKEIIDYSENKEWTKRIYSIPLEQTRSREPQIIIVNTPVHRNIGDYLIIDNMERIFRKRFPLRNIKKISFDEIEKRRGLPPGLISDKDTIVFGGGGYLGNIWASGRMVPVIMDQCIENKVVFFPQSLFFIEDNDKEIWKEYYRQMVKRHTDITICLRDRLSYNRAKELWNGSINLKLLPDVALMMPYKEVRTERNGAILCLRTDVESALCEEQRRRIYEMVFESFKDIRTTSMHYEREVIPGGEMSAINDKFYELCSAELVITDALHCMIMCAITGTPCLAIDNIYGKIQGVYQWLKHLKYIKIFENTDQLLRFNLNNWDVFNRSWEYSFEYEEYEEELFGFVG